MKPFHYEQRWAEPPEEAQQEIVATWSSSLNLAGYSLTSQSPSAVTFAKRYHPGWTIVLAVVFFPLGLLFLMHRRYAPITFGLEPTDPDSTLVTISGLAPGKLVEHFRPKEEIEVEVPDVTGRKSD
jgi:hypothetical protein